MFGGIDGVESMGHDGSGGYGVMEGAPVGGDVASHCQAADNQ